MRRFRGAAWPCIGLVLVLVSLTTEARAQVRRIAFYDPDANHQAILSITQWFDTFLASQSIGLSFQPVQSADAFEDLLADEKTAFAIVPASVLRRYAGTKLAPLLVPAAGGDVFYRKQLLGKTDARDLDGKSIAATLPARSHQEGSREVLAMLRTGGVRVNGASVIPVAKDIDALLALTFGQVQAALVTPSSVAVLRQINPGAVASFKTVFETPRILRPPLCEVRGHATAQEKAALIEALRKMMTDDNGRKAMSTLGFDAWITFTPEMLRS